MQSRDLALTVAAVLVAAGGLYLWKEVRASGAAAPSEQAVAEAAARHARTGPGPSAPRPRRIEDVGVGVTGKRPDRAPAPLDVDRAADDTVRLVNDPRARADNPPEPATDPDLDAAMLEANKLYDRHSYDEARTLALKLLDREPGNVRMLRVVVSSSCILGDAEVAQKHWAALPEFDRGQMTARCDRFGITFKP